MPQEQFTITDWTNELSQCLQELVDYERWLEDELSLLRQQAEGVLGVLSLGVRRYYDDRDDRIRDRVAGYWGFLVDTPHASSPSTMIEMPQSPIGSRGRKPAGRLRRKMQVSVSSIAFNRTTPVPPAAAGHGPAPPSPRRSRP